MLEDPIFIVPLTSSVVFGCKVFMPTYPADTLTNNLPAPTFNNPAINTDPAEFIPPMLRVPEEIKP